MSSKNDTYFIGNLNYFRSILVPKALTAWEKRGIY